MAEAEEVSEVPFTAQAEVVVVAEVKTTTFTAQATTVPPTEAGAGQGPTQQVASTIHPSLQASMQPHLPHIPMGGRLKHFFSQWKCLTSHRTILPMIRGMNLDLTDLSKQTRMPKQLSFTPVEQQAANEQIDTLLKKMCNCTARQTSFQIWVFE